MEKTLIIGIDGMRCKSCTANVERELSGLPGVKLVQVDLALEEARVTFDESLVDPQLFDKAIASLGFSVRNITQG